MMYNLLHPLAVLIAAFIGYPVLTAFISLLKEALNKSG